MGRVSLMLILWAGLCALVPVRAVGADASVVRTSLTIALADGAVLTGPDLAGVILTIADTAGQEIQVRIDGAVLDPDDPEAARHASDQTSAR